jgi:hypothetical protein
MEAVMRTLHALAPLGLLVSTAAFAQPSDAPSPPDKKKGSGTEIVCKHERFVGSKISKRICMSRSEWDLGRAKAREIMDERQMWKNNQSKGGG